MSGLSTHVLDTSRGLPASGVPVRCERRAASGWELVREATTGADGRVSSLLPEGAALAAGVYRLTFALAAYFSTLGITTFYPEATIVFEVREPGEHHHVPLLVSPYGYSTYRGS